MACSTPIKAAVLAAGACFFVTSAFAQSAFLVTTGADSGPGSLRAALGSVAAQATPVPIFVVTDGDIEIVSTLTYSGRLPVTILGNGQTVRISANATVLALTEGADLTVSHLDFEGPGGFSLTSRGDLAGPAGKGIFIDVRDEQTGTVHLVLDEVTISNVAYHGIHVSDCDLADACGGGSGGGGEGAPASIAVSLRNVTVRDVGHGAFDADGIRIDERGAGDIHYSAYGSTFRGVGADGVELDEGDAGHVIATIAGNQFLDNGGYCDLDVLQGFLPSEAEEEFEDGARAETDIPGHVAGSPDDRCFEREVSLFPSGFVESYESSIDLDDGIDIDEAADGGLWVAMTDSAIIGNLDEGVDLDEEDAGDANVAFVRSTAEGNTDDGFRTSETGPGDLIARLYAVSAQENGDNGARFDEADEGTVRVDVDATTTAANDDGRDTGLRVTKEGEGEGTLTVTASELKDGIDARNVTVIRN